MSVTMSVEAEADTEENNATLIAALDTTGLGKVESSRHQ